MRTDPKLLLGIQGQGLDEVTVHFGDYPELIILHIIARQSALCANPDARLVGEQRRHNGGRQFTVCGKEFPSVIAPAGQPPAGSGPNVAVDIFLQGKDGIIGKTAGLMGEDVFHVPHGAGNFATNAGAGGRDPQSIVLVDQQFIDFVDLGPHTVLILKVGKPDSFLILEEANRRCKPDGAVPIDGYVKHEGRC